MGPILPDFEREKLYDNYKPKKEPRKFDSLSKVAIIINCFILVIELILSRGYFDDSTIMAIELTVATILFSFITGLMFKYRIL